MINIILLAIGMTSCKKLVAVNAPVTSVNQLSVYSADATAIAVLTGIYANESAARVAGSNGGGYTLSDVGVYLGLSADEIGLWSGVTATTLNVYYSNSLSAITNGGEYWSTLYPNVFICNAAIEGLNSSSANSLTPAVKKQLLGEAEFMRALYYFYLVNLYGDVPLVTSTDATKNAALPRSPKANVYKAIIQDLTSAQSNLVDGYLDGTLLAQTTDRFRPNKWAATALLARVYLYSGDWSNAEAQSTSIINNSALYNLTSLDSVFLKDNREAVWQLQPVNTSPTNNTQDAYQFIIPATGFNQSTNFLFLTKYLTTSFETSDLRKTHWMNTYLDNTETLYYYPTKYKVNTTTATTKECRVMLRLAEQYLIRAEARAEQGNTSGAATDLNVIRERAGLSATTATSQSTLVTAISHERQVELFTECGHRWMDMKRMGIIDGIMANVTPYKGNIAWNTNQQLYPIYINDILYDKNIAQNPGY